MYDIEELEKVPGGCIITLLRCTNMQLLARSKQDLVL